MCRCVTVALVPVIAFLLYFANNMDAFKTYKANLNCTNIGADVLANSEDFAMYKNGMAFVSDGDLFNLFLTGINQAKKGQIFIMNLNSIDENYMETPKEVPIKGFPTGRNFQPHGIFYSNSTNRLYTVSHPHQGEGSFVEIFTVEENPLTLKHADSVLPTTENMVINDVVEGRSENEIFVSRFQWYAKPLGGELSQKTNKETAEEMKSLLMSFSPGTYIYGCRKENSEWKCGKATEKLGKFYNGLAISANRKFLFAADMFAKLIRIFKITDEGLMFHKDIQTSHAVDNIDFDTESQDLIGGTHVSLWRALARLKIDPNIPAPTSVSVFKGSPEAGYTEVDDLLHDGTVLSTGSTGVIWGDSVVIGSPFAPGIAVCVRNS